MHELKLAKGMGEGGRGGGDLGVCIHPHNIFFCFFPSGGCAPHILGAKVPHILGAKVPHIMGANVPQIWGGLGVGRTPRVFVRVCVGA